MKLINREIHVDILLKTREAQHIVENVFRKIVFKI